MLLALGFAVTVGLVGAGAPARIMEGGLVAFPTSISPAAAAALIGRFEPVDRPAAAFAYGEAAGARSTLQALVIRSAALPDAQRKAFLVGAGLGWKPSTDDPDQLLALLAEQVPADARPAFVFGAVRQVAAARADDPAMVEGFSARLRTATGIPTPQAMAMGLRWGCGPDLVAAAARVGDWPPEVRGPLLEQLGERAVMEGRVGELAALAGAAPLELRCAVAYGAGRGSVLQHPVRGSVRGSPDESLAELNGALPDCAREARRGMAEGLALGLQAAELDLLLAETRDPGLHHAVQARHGEPDTDFLAQLQQLSHGRLAPLEPAAGGP